MAANERAKLDVPEEKRTAKQFDLDRLTGPRSTASQRKNLMRYRTRKVLAPVRSPRDANERLERKLRRATIYQLQKWIPRVERRTRGLWEKLKKIHRPELKQAVANAMTQLVAAAEAMRKEYATRRLPKPTGV
jgi:hypothetical protein